MEMESYLDQGVIGEGSVGVSFEWSLEGMVDGHGWVMLGVVGYSEEEVAVAVEY